MISHPQDGIRVERINGRQLISVRSRVELVRKTDTISDLRTDLEPLELEIASETHFGKIVRQIHQYRFLSVAAHIKTRTASSNKIRSVITVPFCRPLQV